MNHSLSFSLSRREFVRRSALGAAGLALATALPCSVQAASRKKIPVGLQLYSIREQAQKDTAGMIATVAKIGYNGVEFAGYYGHSAKDLRKMMDDNGVVCCGTHTPYESVLPGKLQETIEFNHTLGNKFLIVPWMEGKTKQDWLDKAKLFNELAAKVKKEGMFVGYHAHAGDFKLFEGTSAWDLFFGNTKPAVVMQLDTSNCRDGGADPVAVLKNYPGRARTIHLKASGGGPDAVIGEDKVPWNEVFQFCEKKGKTQWYIVEHESGKDPVDAVRRSFEALRKLGKV